MERREFTMYYSIRLENLITFDAIKEHWIIKGQNVSKIDFHINKGFKFAVFSESLALAKLRDFEMENIEIGILFAGRAPAKNIQTKDIPEYMFSIFGLQLLYFCKSASFKDSTTNYKGAIGELIWSIAYEAKDVLDRGSRKYFISRSNQPLARALCESGAEREFPKVDDFKSSLLNNISTMKSNTSSWARDEQKLAEWAFHNAENTYDHGSKRSNSVINGFRGIKVEKIRFEINALPNRKDLPEIIKNHILSRFKSGEYFEERTFMLVSVFDDGVGIQNSLVAKPDEDSYARLLYALRDGVSSKRNDGNQSIPAEPEEGYGLGDMLESASRLNALVYVVSEGVAAYFDFSEVFDDKDFKNYSRTDHTKDSAPDFMLHYDGESGADCGTSITLCWASPNISNEQTSDILTSN